MFYNADLWTLFTINCTVANVQAGRYTKYCVCTTTWRRRRGQFAVVVNARLQPNCSGAVTIISGAETALTLCQGKEVLCVLNCSTPRPGNTRINFVCILYIRIGSDAWQRRTIRHNDESRSTCSKNRILSQESRGKDLIWAGAHAWRKEGPLIKAVVKESPIGKRPLG